MRRMGIKIPENFEKLQRSAAVKVCEDALESFNAWLSGDCYGVITQVFDREGDEIDEDSCWGYVGHGYARQELTDRVASEIRHHIK